jgi:hypothetical protein
MKSWKKPTNEMIDKTLKLVKKGTGSRYFFSRLKNPLWIQPLVEHGCFQSPPSKIEYFDDSDDVYVQFPSWPELQYLKNVSRDVPDEVINVVLDLPPVDNPSVYNEILEIALQLDGEQSVKLKPKILESIDMDYQFLPHRYGDLLAHWTSENQTSAALELTKILIEFAPDPQLKVKEKRRRENPTDFATFCETSLEPSPQIVRLEYKEIMSTGVRPLAEKEPYQVACLLIDTTTNMIYLRMHQEELDQEVDLSEIWYERFHEMDIDYGDPDKTLVHTLIFACKQVYEKSPDSIVALDKILRNQPWGVFKRLRQHLYAQYPNEQTKPWIHELILEHKDYSQWEHRYEFQQMIRNSCEHFSASLLTEAERTQIFNAIRSGPSKEDFQKRLGEEFTEEKFLQHQRSFHRKQFKPFESVLFGKYSTYFRELENKAADSISDEDYPPIKTMGGAVSNHSPHSPKDLENLTDGKLLTFINEWEGNELFPEEDSIVEINIEGLAGAFQAVFEKSILPDANRLRFWIENRERIKRPIYVRMMIDGMQAEVKEKNFNRLDEWLTFNEWVLLHPNQEHKSDYRLGRQGDESRDNPDWYNSRETVGTFIEICLGQDVDVPKSARIQLAKLLEMLCTQYDRHLDQQEIDFLNRNDLIDEAINNTRGRALETLVKFGFWLRRHDSGAEVHEMTTILEKRFAPETEYPLTLPEYAILGRRYSWVCSLNEAWAAEHKSDFFPQDTLPEWLAAFSNFVGYNPQSKSAFEILRDDFDFALQYLAEFKKRHDSNEKQTNIFGRHLKQNSPEEKLTEGIGRHLSTYYLWGMYPLRASVGNNNHYSLLERYYQVTNDNREHWANLFDYVGRILWNTHEQLDKELKNRIIAFFEWRLEVEEPCELRQFAFWLQANCLDAKWRLEAYSKILAVCEGESVSIRLKTLSEMIPDHTAKVVECFAKLTNKIKNNDIYIAAEDAKIILKAGFKSSDESVRQNAERAHENLLREGRFDLLDLDD